MGCCSGKAVEGVPIKRQSRPEPVRKEPTEGTVEGEAVSSVGDVVQEKEKEEVIHQAGGSMERAEGLLKEPILVVLNRNPKFKEAFDGKWDRATRVAVENCWKHPADRHSVNRIRGLVDLNLFDAPADNASSNNNNLASGSAAPTSEFSATATDIPHTIEWESASDVSSSDEAGIVVVAGETAVYEPEKMR